LGGYPDDTAVKQSMTVYSVSFRTIRVPKIVVLVDAATLRKAERLIESCEHCNPEGAEIPFDNILDRVTGSDPRVTDLHP
jgi:hypothetical protein